MSTGTWLPQARKWVGVICLGLSVAFLPSTAWATTTEPTPATTTATTTEPTPTPTETVTQTVTATPTSTDPVQVAPVQLDADQFALFAVVGGLVLAFGAGTFVLGMRR